MKKIKYKAPERIYFEYICEICFRKSYHEHIIKQCELSHSCKHDKFKYEIDITDEYCCDLIKICSICDKKFRKVDLYSYNNQEILKQIYEELDANS